MTRVERVNKQLARAGMEHLLPLPADVEAKVKAGYILHLEKRRPVYHPHLGLLLKAQPKVAAAYDARRFKHLGNAGAALTIGAGAATPIWVSSVGPPEEAR